MERALWKRALWVILLGLAAQAFAQEGAEQEKVDIRKLGDEIICTCACNATLNNCQNSMTCNEAVMHKAELQEMIDQGLTKDEIFARMVEKYGETILATPTKRGFNLTAWVMPFAAMFAGGLLIAVVVRKWTRGQGAAALETSESETPPTPRDIDPDLDKRIENELKDLGD